MAALGLAGLWVCERRTVTSAVLLEARLQHVLSLLDPGSPLALRVRTRLAAEADYFHGTHAAVLAALAEVRAAQLPGAAGARPAKAAGAAGGDPELLAEALSLAHHCLLDPAHVRLRRDLAVEMVKASFRTERRSDLLMGLLWQAADAYCAGDPHAGRLLGEVKDHLAEHGHLAVGFVVSAIDVMLAIRAGRFDEAEALAAVCARSGAAAGDADHEWWHGAQLVTIRWYQGRPVELAGLPRSSSWLVTMSAHRSSTPRPSPGTGTASGSWTPRSTSPGRTGPAAPGPNATGSSASCPAPRASRGGRGPSPTSPSAPGSRWARPSAGRWPGSPRPIPSSASTCARPCTPGCAAPTGSVPEQWTDPGPAR